MDYSNTQKLTQAINSPADLTREEVLLVLKECANIQSSFSQQSSINKLIHSCVNYKKYNTLTNMLKLIATRAVFSFLNVQMINVNDAFNFLLQTNNVLECYEILKLFQENQVDLPDRSIDLVISGLIANKHFEQASELLFKGIRNDKVLNLNFREHIKLLLLHQETDLAFSILEKLPVTSIGSLYLWEDVIRNSCKSDKAHQFREFLSKHAKKTLPNGLKELEEIYSTLIKYLLDNKCSKELMIMTLRDVSANTLQIKLTALKPALHYLIIKSIDIDFLIKILKEFNYLLTSDIYSTVLSKLLQSKQFPECLGLLDLIIHDTSFKFRYADINLTMNDFKLIVYLQNYAIRREKLGDTNPAGNDYELLLPDKSINDPIDKITFDEVSSYLSKDQYEFS